MALIEVSVTAIVEEGQGNRALRLEPVAGALPAFEAGAHVDLHLPGGLVRQYSIASAPHVRDHYLLCVRHAADSRGGSRHVCEQLAGGQRLWISEPRNLFPLQPGGPQLLLAAGIGITPLLSMAQALDARGEAFVLHYYVRSMAQAAFLPQLRTGFAHGRVELHASEAGQSPRTHVPEELLQASHGHLYLCGPVAFMDRYAALAAAAGWPAAQVHREHFGALDSALPGDGAFEVELASSGQVVTVPADASIASVLLAAGIPVDLSCEQGMCGACLTGVLAGEPDHRDCVLSDGERAANDQITVCCSRSRSPRLVLDL